MRKRRKATNKTRCGRTRQMYQRIYPLPRSKGKEGEGEMKEMVYSTKPIKEVLHNGQYKGYEFCILNLGTHPTAYVECKLKNCSSYGDERLDGISVHGGFTYFGKGYWDNNEKDYLGWDYAHYMDYAGYELMFPESMRGFGNKKWTTTEIYEEVKSVIDQLLRTHQNDEVRE